LLTQNNIKIFCEIYDVDLKLIENLQYNPCNKNLNIILKLNNMANKQLKTNIVADAKFTPATTNVEYPKYFKLQVNMANQVSRATSKKNIGNLNEIFTRFRSVTKTQDQTVENWKAYYTSLNPEAIETAIQKVSAKYLEIIQNVGNPNTKKLNKHLSTLIATWVESLIIEKTYNGMMAQVQVLSQLAQYNSMKITRATSQEDSRGIDAYIGSTSVNVKPVSYNPVKVTADQVVYYRTDAGKLIIGQ
jgi:hypothetical protein